MATMTSKGEQAAKLEKIASIWNSRAHGLIGEMNLKIEKVEESKVVLRMPFNPDFCVDDEGTLLHGGILTALLDSSFGLANFLATDNVQSMSTIDLRVEYLRPAQSRADIIVSAECYHITRHVAFNSGRAWFDAPGNPEVARGSAAFSLIRGEGSMLDKMNTGGPGG